MIAIIIYSAMQWSCVRVTQFRQKLIALRFFNIKNLVFPKICITFANEIQKDNDLVATLMNVSSFK